MTTIGDQIDDEKRTLLDVLAADVGLNPTQEAPHGAPGGRGGATEGNHPTPSAAGAQNGTHEIEGE